jgi:hypothetical protein
LAKGTPPQDQNTTPEEFPSVSPRELYPTSDIRFVIVEIAKLTTKVERLIEDVNGHGDKIDALRHQVTFVKGAMWVIGGIMTLVVLALGWYFIGKLSISLTPGK